MLIFWLLSTIKFKELFHFKKTSKTRFFESITQVPRSPRAPGTPVWEAPGGSGRLRDGPKILPKSRIWSRNGTGRVATTSRRTHWKRTGATDSKMPLKPSKKPKIREK